ncbi:SGNH/GDSL hydrolase family protein [Aliiruegeria lutimaris]|uniref:SGNH/GDSL hydrolase family protein n=1 Tax=Aliiruegeria lutimaris TaxID=571298 RepID=A0A1G9AY76_9RHOB|nr:SGNH/GDSL hydrolase family protein [Aliiruegeria lutimaris]SDK32173.1 hypothetical protein SAMN04488026_103738 [Aliiruegeria lutimaris]
MRKLLIASLALFGLFGQAAPVISEEVAAAAPNAAFVGDAKVVAIYGNSYTHYNNNLNTRLRDLTRSLLPNNAKGYSYRGLSISSARLGWHLPNLRFQNEQKHWDAVIFQGNSIEQIHQKPEARAYFTESATEMARIAHDAGSSVVYFMTWARKANPEQTEALARAYVEIAEKTGGYVAPVGLAFARAMQEHPEIELYFVDGKHPSLEGTYLAACVFFATLYIQSPVGGDVPIGSDMSKETAAKLQAIAWETVQAFRNTL